MKIVFLDSGTLSDKTSLSTIEKHGAFKAFVKTAPEEVSSRIKDADIVITNKVIMTEELISNAPKLKLIISAATGMNHIDSVACKKNNIVLKNVENYSTESVAQHTFAMLFHLMHSSEYFQNYTRSLEWETSPFFTHLGKTFSEIKGKTWGIIGLGTIGKRVATLAECFGAKVVYYSSSGLDRSDKYKRLELNELLESSHIISIHSPLNNKTNNLLNKTNLSLIKNGSILLNLGRGGIINEEDLVIEFKKRVLFLGLDVLEVEPLAKNAAIQSIFDSERVFITPHIAWASNEARDNLVEKISNHILNFKK